MGNQQQRDVGYDFIRGLSILLIIIYHFYHSCVVSTNKFPLFLEWVINHYPLEFGKIGVCLFFMLSGAVLILSKQEKIKEFYKKRFLRIEVPQWIAFILAYLFIWVHPLFSAPINLSGTIISFFGLNYFNEPWQVFGIKSFCVVGEWFSAVIILLYLIFPFLKYLFYKSRLITTIAILILFALNLKYQILSGDRGWFSITNALMCFWLGMLFEEYKNHFSSYYYRLAGIMAIIIYLIKPAHIWGYPQVSCMLFSILLFIALYNVKISNAFTKYFSKYSYEIYLIHHNFYLCFIPLFFANNTTTVQFILVFFILTGMICLIAEFINKLSNKTIQKINQKIG